MASYLTSLATVKVIWCLNTCSIWYVFQEILTGESHSAIIFVIVFPMTFFAQIQNAILIFIKTTRVCKAKEI
jgi:uncharacterized membrane protein